MAEGQEPSFGRLVFGKAIADTANLFKSKVADAGYIFVSGIVGCGLYDLFWGLPRAMSEALPIVMFSFAPLGIFVAAVFLWHLWLAPSALAYEAARKAFEASENMHPLLQVKVAAPIDWAIYKERQQLTAFELAAILAKSDPAASDQPFRQHSFLQLILETINSGALSYVPRYGHNYEGEYEKEINEFTPIKRAAALAWVDSKKFDVTHIR